MRHISYSNYRKEKEKEELKNNPPAAKKTPVGEPSTPVSETGVWGTIKDIGKGIAAGIPKAAEDTLETIKDVTEGLDTVTKAVTGGTIAPRTADLEMANLREPKEGPDAKIDLVPEVMKPETALGKTAMNLSSWAASYISGGKQLGAAFKGTKIMAGAAKASPLLAKVISGGVGGAVADLVTTDTADEGLADIMVNNKVMGSEMVRFLATKEDDSKAVIRLKRTAEGFLTGAALDTFMEAFSAVRRSG
ncbi:MAG: hypothetical protein RR091_12425, partial [Cloacibacillus sp.]